MYFWRIRRLRQALTTAPISEQAAVNYLIAFTIFYLALIFGHSLVPADPPPLWYPFYLIGFFIIKIIGILTCFKFNGGKQGKEFLTRYISLAWVEMVRFVVFGMIILVVGLFAVEIFVGEQVLKTPHFLWMAGFMVVWLIFYYWRLCVHFRYIYWQA